MCRPDELQAAGVTRLQPLLPSAPKRDRGQPAASPPVSLRGSCHPSAPQLPPVPPPGHGEGAGAACGQQAPAGLRSRGGRAGVHLPSRGGSSRAVPWCGRIGQICCTKLPKFIARALAMGPLPVVLWTALTSLAAQSVLAWLSSERHLRAQLSLF